MKRLFYVFLMIIFSTSVMADTWEETISTTAYVNTNGLNFNVTGEGGSTLNAMCIANVSTSIPLGITMRRNITHACANTTIYTNNTCAPSQNVTYNLSACDEFAKVARLMENLTINTDKITGSFSESVQYYPLYTGCYYNFTICNVELQNMKSKETTFDACAGERGNAITQLNGCNAAIQQQSINNTKMEQRAKNAESSRFLWFVVGAGVVGAAWGITQSRKTKRSPPSGVGQLPGTF